MHIDRDEVEKLLCTRRGYSMQASQYADGVCLAHLLMPACQSLLVVLDPTRTMLSVISITQERLRLSQTLSSASASFVQK